MLLNPGKKLALGPIQRALGRQLHTLQYAVSFCAKGTLRNQNRCFGEDSAVVETWITPGTLQGYSLVSVADGVGGWRRHGVDSSFLSQGLTREMVSIFGKQEHDMHDGKKHPSCQPILTAAFTKLYNAGAIYAGGSTVCMGLFDPHSAKLEVLNLGDSGAIVIRDGKVVNATVADVDGMTPRQLTILPATMDPRDFDIDLEPASQTRSESTTWQLQKNDTVIFATDGFFDNVSLKDIPAAIEEASSSEKPNLVQEIADSLISRAYYNSLDPNFASPFALRCLQEGNYNYWGGKPDDISLVCCFVGENHPAHHTENL